MKQIALTMRIEYCKKLNEKRDSIDQRWYDFLHACNTQAVLIGNFHNDLTIQNILKNISGIILTGGNSLYNLNGDALERDVLEKNIIKYAIEQNIPVLGICRGMQIIQDFYGIKLDKIPNHVNTRHNLTLEGYKINVNSFHNYGTVLTCPQLDILSKASDGIIEAVRHKVSPILGIMWHPEREQKFSGTDIELVKNHMKI